METAKTETFLEALEKTNNLSDVELKKFYVDALSLFLCNKAPLDEISNTTLYLIIENFNNKKIDKVNDIIMTLLVLLHKQYAMIKDVVKKYPLEFPGLL